MLAEPEQVKGLEFDHVYLLGLHRGGIATRIADESWVPRTLCPSAPEGSPEELAAAGRARLAYLAATRARIALVLSWPQSVGDSPAPASPFYEAAREALSAEEEIHEEELFGPAEGLHATYRMLRDEVLEASWRAGGAISEMRLDTAEDVNTAVARFLELVKLAALIQRPGTEPAADALAAIGELLARVASPEQRAVLESSALDEYVVGEERERDARQGLVAARREPSLEAFLPRRGDGLALSASDIDLYRICPLKYKFARVFAIPQEPTINQRFGILIHQVLERFHSEELRETRSDADAGGDTAAGGSAALSIGCSPSSRRAGVAPGSAPPTMSSSTATAPSPRSPATTSGRRTRRRAPCGSSAASISASARIIFAGGSIASIVGGDGEYELIDYKTGGRKDHAQVTDDVQLALYRIGAREAWQIEASEGSYWYVLDDERGAGSVLARRR